MRKLGARFLVAGLMAGAVSACGQGGTDPFTAIGPADTTPQLGLTVSGGSFSGGGVQFSTSNPFITGAVTFGAAIGAPADGLVTAVEAGVSGGSAVTLFHNFRIRSKISGITTTLRVGDYIVATAALGTVTSTQFTFQVVVDEVAVCPVSYLSSTGRAALTTFFGGGNPCL